jgi:hypothetical protein
MEAGTMNVAVTCQRGLVPGKKNTVQED